MNERIRANFNRIFSNETVLSVARFVGETNFRSMLAINIAASELLLDICQRVQAGENPEKLFQLVEQTRLHTLDLTSSECLEGLSAHGNQILNEGFVDARQLIEDIGETSQIPHEASLAVLQICLPLVLRCLGKTDGDQDPVSHGHLDQKLQDELKLFCRTYAAMKGRSDIPAWYFFNLESQVAIGSTTSGLPAMEIPGTNTVSQ